jgi:hypothetical protein
MGKFEMRRSTSLITSSSRLFVLVCLVYGYFFPSVAADAQTAAGTSISDSASATYVDPNNSGTTVNATSNTVTVTVAEVAGMTLTASGVTNHTTGGSNNLPGNTLYYNYTITNTGNDPTDFVIPGTATLTGPITLVSVAYSIDGTTYNTVSGASATTSSVAEGGTVKVRGTVTVNSSASPGDTMSVLVGNVNPNDNSSGTQDAAYPSAPTAGTGKCYTQDIADGGATGEVNGAPPNGEREASGT